MSNISGVSGLSQSYLNESAETKKSTAKEDTAEKTTAKNEEAAVYESSGKKTSEKTNGGQNTELVKQMKADLENRKSQLQSMVEKMLNKQGQAYEKGTNIFELIRTGKLNVDPETAAQAQKDIADDGYWGVEQTSDRMVSFAKALTGNDPSKADKMLDAFKKGFEAATKSWGDKLPDISQKTYDATLKKFDDWKNSTATTQTQA